MAPTRRTKRAARIEVRPLTPDRWPDLEALFGPRGAVSGCWCMWWRTTRAEFDANAGDGNRAAFRARVREGDPPGLLAYLDGSPAGWCAVAPRAEFPRIERSRPLKPVDDAPAWAIVCFFIDRGARGRGVAGTLLRAACDFARDRGARLVEGYPVSPDARTDPGALFTGTVAMFESAGFREAADRGGRRKIMRRNLRPRRS
jgi:GNAT superfamily N-acetyltransferase